MDKKGEKVMNRCIFCGETLTEQGVCPNMAQHYKPMCINCIHCSVDGENCICTNEDNKADAVQKIMSSYEGGYKITNIELSPIPLKDPTKKCKRHSLASDLILNHLIMN